MLRILWNSKSAMLANQNKLDVISNNLANVNTDGYKRVEVSFQDLMTESLERSGYPISENAEPVPFTGTGVKTSPLIRDHRQGNLIETNKTTDLGIDGRGFFRIERSNGTIAYTRAGKFDVDQFGKIVDPGGNRLFIRFNEEVDPETVQFAKDNLHINYKGEVTVQENGIQRLIGAIPTFNAEGRDAFRSVGENIYETSEGVEVYEVGDNSLMQGFIESSNVDMVSEMTDMILTQRAFELGSRGIKTADEMWGMVNNLRGR
jgi:flagellar basal-body rod protein FlgG